MPYAYKNLDEENPKKIYKNFIIRYDDDPKSNLNNCFGEPIFDNPRSITIPIDKSSNPLILPKNWASILVSIEKGFFYSVEISPGSKIKKSVKMSQSKRWIYEVNDKTDSTPPTITNDTITINEADTTNISEASLSSTANKLSYTKIAELVTSHSMYYTNKIYVDFNLSDLNNINKNFQIYYRKVYDEKYSKDIQNWESKDIFYHSAGKDAAYKGVIDFTDQEYGLADGLYQVYFKFSDGSNNAIYLPGKTQVSPETSNNTYNLCIDNETGVKYPVQTLIRKENEMTIKLVSDVQNLPGDFKHVVLSYKKASENDSSYTPITYDYNDTQNLASATINLPSWESYTIKLEYEDYIGNKNIENPFTYTTLPPTITPHILDYSSGDYFSPLDLVTVTLPAGTSISASIKELPSNTTINPVEGKYQLKQGNAYNIAITLQKQDGSLFSKNYNIFTKPSMPDVRFTPVVNSHSGNEYQCKLSYIIPRIPSENSGIRYKVNGVETSNNKGTTTIKYISGSTPEVSPFTVETLPPAGINFEVTDSSSFVAPLNLQYYGKTKEAVIQNNTVMAFKVQRYYDNLPSANLSDTAINIVYNGNLLAGPQVITYGSTGDVTISIENNSIPVDTSLKASQGMYFVIESVKYSTLKYIARDEYVICPTAATAVSNLVYNKDNKTLTWTNPPQDEFATIKIYAEYKPVGSGSYQIPTRALFGEISDKSINSYVCSNIQSLELFSSLKFSVNTTNAAGAETTKEITVK